MAVEFSARSITAAIDLTLAVSNAALDVWLWLKVSGNGPQGRKANLVALLLVSVSALLYLAAKIAVWKFPYSFNARTALGHSALGFGWLTAAVALVAALVSNNRRITLIISAVISGFLWSMAALASALVLA